MIHVSLSTTVSLYPNKQMLSATSQRAPPLLRAQVALPPVRSPPGGPWLAQASLCPSVLSLGIGWSQLSMWPVLASEMKRMVLLWAVGGAAAPRTGAPTAQNRTPRREQSPLPLGVARSAQDAGSCGRPQAGLGWNQHRTQRRGDEGAEPAQGLHPQAVGDRPVAVHVLQGPAFCHSRPLHPSGHRTTATPKALDLANWPCGQVPAPVTPVLCAVVSSLWIALVSSGFPVLLVKPEMV